MSADYVAVDQVWQKPDGTAPVRIGRVWTNRWLSLWWTPRDFRFLSWVHHNDGDD